MKPDCANAYFQQVKALLALGQADEAARSLQVAFRLDPSKKDAFRQTYPDLYRDGHLRRRFGFDH